MASVPSYTLTLELVIVVPWSKAIQNFWICLEPKNLWLVYRSSQLTCPLGPQRSWTGRKLDLRVHCTPVHLLKHLKTSCNETLKWSWELGIHLCRRQSHSSKGWHEFWSMLQSMSELKKASLSCKSTTHLSFLWFLHTLCQFQLDDYTRVNSNLTLEMTKIVIFDVLYICQLWSLWVQRSRIPLSLILTHSKQPGHGDWPLRLVLHSSGARQEI